MSEPATKTIASYKVLGVFSLTLINIAIVGNLQTLPALASYGYALVTYYAMVLITFFIPCLLITAQLVTHFPLNGGSYIWIERAFNAKWGFFASALLWFCNVIWYPSIFALIMAGIYYLIDPALVNNKLLMWSGMVALFWIVTILNCFGIRLSSFITGFCAIVGLVVPTIVIFICGIVWSAQAGQNQLHFSAAALIPSFSRGEFAFLITIIITLLGIEMSAAHVTNVKNPERNFPRALAYSGILLVIILIGAALGIAMIVPANKISLISSVMESINLFFATTKHFWLGQFMIALIVLGNLGSIIAWMLSVTCAMRVGAVRNHLPRTLQKINRHGAPIGLLLSQAIVVTALSLIQLLFPTVNNFYWALLDTSSQMSLIYYVLLFISAYRLVKSTPTPGIFNIPGGKFGTGICVVLASLSCITAFGMGFVPPPDLAKDKIWVFETFLVTGLFIACALPFILLKMANPTQVNSSDLINKQED